MTAASSSEGSGTAAFTPYLSVQAVGTWFGLMSCKKCGAAILLETDSDNADIHLAWHATMEHTT